MVIYVTIKADHRHLYLQVIDRLKSDIETGVFKENEKLPSEFELSKSLGVSRATLREALRLLEEENVIVRRHGLVHLLILSRCLHLASSIYPVFLL